MSYYFEPEEIQKVLNKFREVFEYTVNLNRPSITVKTHSRLAIDIMEAIKTDTPFYISFVYARASETLEILCDLDHEKWKNDQKT
jgi:hypothetical protein